MKITVCLKEVLDPVLSLDAGLDNPVVFKEGRPFRLNPDDAAALSMALDFGKKSGDTEITVISIGPERVERYLREGLSLGADRAVRIWNEGFDGLSPYRKARVLDAAVKLLGADLVLAGSRSLDTGNARVGGLLAAWLDLPFVTNVLKFEPDTLHNITVVKALARGAREKLLCPLPSVIAVRGELNLSYASLDDLIESRYAPVTLLSPADLGMSPLELGKDPTPVASLVFPHPAPRKAPPLDSSLPAFYRIFQLLEGGIAKRKVRMLRGSREELVEQLFQLLKDEGVLRRAVD